MYNEKKNANRSVEYYWELSQQAEEICQVLERQEISKHGLFYLVSFFSYFNFRSRIEWEIKSSITIVG